MVRFVFPWRLLLRIVFSCIYWLFVFFWMKMFSASIVLFSHIFLLSCFSFLQVPVINFIICIVCKYFHFPAVCLFTLYCSLCLRFLVDDILFVCCWFCFLWEVGVLFYISILITTLLNCTLHCHSHVLSLSRIKMLYLLFIFSFHTSIVTCHVLKFC